MFSDPLAVSPVSTAVTTHETSSDTRIAALKAMLRTMEAQVQSALALLESHDTPTHLPTLSTSPAPVQPASGQRIVEGVFDGQKMCGDDGQFYSMAQNYASKSKLVVGDRLKLHIAGSGTFVFKQIGPVPRRRVVGVLAKDTESTQFFVVKGDERWKVLTASVTYFRGDAGDEAIVLVPEQGSVSWAAVENIVKKSV